MEDNMYSIEDDSPAMAAEPVAMMSESVGRSGLLGQVMKLSRNDTVALMKYLCQDTEQPGFTVTDELGRVVLTQEMREAVRRAEREYEDGKCLSEEQFRQRFSKWL